jgi:hypothetical protein
LENTTLDLPARGSHPFNTDLLKTTDDDQLVTLPNQGKPPNVMANRSPEEFAEILVTCVPGRVVLSIPDMLPFCVYAHPNASLVKQQAVKLRAFLVEVLKVDRAYRVPPAEVNVA